jgi:alpha-glucosidase
MNQVRLTTTIEPRLDTLPVFVRGGSILPIAPLVQSTNDVPQGPLTLRVYAGRDCGGTLYQDDGRSYAYQHGEYLRVNFHCQMTADGFHLQVSSHEGSYAAWWKDLRIEIYGEASGMKSGVVNGNALSAPIATIPNGLAVEVPDDGRGIDLRLQ